MEPADYGERGGTEHRHKEAEMHKEKMYGLRYLHGGLSGARHTARERYAYL
jgi:hypothetical protein